ncbi:MAG: hypothetical protein Q9160_006963 [Pyrenula sp. 1 TL-2023]
MAQTTAVTATVPPITADTATETATVPASAADLRLTTDEGYILDHSYLAAARLNFQYFLWQRALGFTIHESALPAVVQRAEIRVIADVATGTALWAIDVAKEHPTAQVHGFDIDLSQAPPKEWLPSNVSLRRWDIFEDPPEELLGTYDLVHVRLLLLVLTDVDPQPIIRRFFSLLKPGGSLQWDDLDCVNMYIKRVGSGKGDHGDCLTPTLDGIVEMNHSDQRFDWTIKLPELVAREGFVDPQLQRYDDPEELSRAFNDQHLMTMEEVAVGLRKVSKYEDAMKVSRMVHEGYKESQKGAGICFPRVVCNARKPE